MARFTITPWKHPADLLTVRQQLYRLPTQPSTPAEESEKQPTDSRRYAVDRVAAWKLRSSLPHAVESTALLIDAQLHHQHATTAASGVEEASDFAVRAVYAAAFTRFVTGFCDIGRSRERAGLEQSSMLAIARTIGMPAHFVTLRHEAVHEELPGLRRLVGVVAEALEWLWGNYWARLDERGTGSAQRDVRGELTAALRNFRRERRDALRGRAKRGEELVRQAAERCFQLCDGRGKRGAATLIVDVLIAERLLLPTNRSTGEAMDGAYMIWDEILAALRNKAPHVGAALVDALLTAITNVSETRPEHDADKEARALWILHLTKTIATDRADAVMQRCCLHPGHWTQFIGELVLDGGDDSLREAWSDIFAASVLSGEAEGNAEEVDGASAADEGRMDVDMDGVGGRWTRAVLRPSVPIGVVC